MSITSAGKAIRNARIQAGLTQEQLAENICSVVALSNIENGKCGVSPSTFALLMSRAGQNTEAYPIFENFDDYNCFQNLVHARFYLEHWKNPLAAKELNELQSRNFSNNKIYYQEYLVLETLLQIRSSSDALEDLLVRLHLALSITHPNLDFYAISKESLSVTDLECLILIAYVSFELNKQDITLSLCSQLYDYLDNMYHSNKRLLSLQVLFNLVFALYLLNNHEYQKAFAIIRKGRSLSLANNAHAYLIESTLLYGIAMYFQIESDKKIALNYVNASLISAEALSLPIISRMIRLVDSLNLPLKAKFSYVPKPSYPLSSKKNLSNFGEGIFDISGNNVLKIGDLISTFRKQQRLSQETLCQGLCSKSKLSKIENSTQDGDILLISALLNRLGYSELEYCFFGNQKEEKYDNIIPFLISHKDILSDSYKIALDELKKLGNKNKLVMQDYYDTYIFNYINDKNERLDKYRKALDITIPDFNIKKILNYRLTGTEISLLSGIARTLSEKSHCNEALYYFSQLCSYVSDNNLDIIFTSSFYPNIILLYTRYMYTEKMLGAMAGNVSNPQNYEICSYYIGSLSLLCYYYAKYYKDNCESTNSRFLFYRYSRYALSLSLMIDDHFNYSVIKRNI